MSTRPIDAPTHTVPMATFVNYEAEERFLEKAEMKELYELPNTSDVHYRAKAKGRTVSVKTDFNKSQVSK